MKACRRTRRYVGYISTAEIVSARVLMSSAAEHRALQGRAVLLGWFGSGRAEIKEKLNLKSAEDLLLCLPPHSRIVSDYNTAQHTHMLKLPGNSRISGGTSASCQRCRD